MANFYQIKQGELITMKCRKDFMVLNYIGKLLILDSAGIGFV